MEKKNNSKYYIRWFQLILIKMDEIIQSISVLLFYGRLKSVNVTKIISFCIIFF